MGMNRTFKAAVVVSVGVIFIGTLVGGGLWLRQQVVKADQEKGEALFMANNWLEAAKYLQASAERGDRLSQSFLGIMFKYGCASSKPYRLDNFVGALPDDEYLNNYRCWKYHGKPDLQLAAKWIERAAEQNSDSDQYELGLMYSQGQGVPQDYVLAHMWLNLAAARGNEDAVKGRDIVASKMTPAQIAEAQKLAREWKPK